MGPSYACLSMAGHFEHTLLQQYIKKACAWDLQKIHRRWHWCYVNELQATPWFHLICAELSPRSQIHVRDLRDHVRDLWGVYRFLEYGHLLKTGQTDYFGSLQSDRFSRIIPWLPLLPQSQYKKQHSVFPVVIKTSPSLLHRWRLRI